MAVLLVQPDFTSTGFTSVAGRYAKKIKSYKIANRAL